MPRKKTNSQSVAAQFARLEARIAELKAQNTELKKKLKSSEAKATAFEHMIDLAESLGMPVTKKLWHQTVKDLHAGALKSVPIDELCGLFGKTKQAFYKRNNVQQDKWLDELEERIVEFVKAKRSNTPRIGGRKLWVMFYEENPSLKRVGRDRFFQILRKYGLTILRVKHRTRNNEFEP